MSITGRAGKDGDIAFIQSTREVKVPVITNSTPLLTEQELIAEDTALKQKKPEAKTNQHTTWMKKLEARDNSNAANSSSGAKRQRHE